ncbi:hypothetical protein WMF38_44525 [Sorangium sp. So ce118]
MDKVLSSNYMILFIAAMRLAAEMHPISLLSRDKEHGATAVEYVRANKGGHFMVHCFDESSGV